MSRHHPSLDPEYRQPPVGTLEIDLATKTIEGKIIELEELKASIPQMEQGLKDAELLMRTQNVPDDLRLSYETLKEDLKQFLQKQARIEKEIGDLQSARSWGLGTLNKLRKDNPQ